jgi:hypothetical protein
MVAPDPSCPNGRHARADATAEPDGRSEGHNPAVGPHPLEPLMAHLAQLRRHAELYVEATADSLRLTVRQTALRAVLAVLGLVVGAALLVTASVLTLNGVAGGIAAALGGRIWAGQLITGLVLLIGVALACWLGIRRITATSRRKTIEKYERRHHDESGRFRHEAAEHARHGRPL